MHRYFNLVMVCWFAGVASWFSPQAIAQQQPEGGAQLAAKLIPREVIFGNPQKAAARISPNGKWISYLAPVDGVLNVWVAEVGMLDQAKPVTEDKVRGIRSYSWAYTGDHILYTQDKKGDENWHVYATDVRTQTTKDLTPVEGVHARIEGVSEHFPNEVLIGLNDRVPQLHDIWRVNLQTGEKELLQENPGMAAFLSDDQFRVRFAMSFTPQGGLVVLEPGDEGKWSPYVKVGSEDVMTFGPLGFDKTGDRLYLIDSRGRDTAALFTVDLKDNDAKPELVAENDKADVGMVLVHPTKKTIQAVAFTYARRAWEVKDPAIKTHLDALEELEDGEFQITSRTLDDKLWTVAYILDDGPVKYFLYDTSTKKAKFLFTNRDDLEQYDLVKMHPEIIKSRDGLNLVSYLSLPPGTDTDVDGRPDKPQPMVLYVHGGPWSRDGWGYDAAHQWLANRGYAVLSVNFRGSTGFGKSFINAANGEWSGNMHNDLIDAVDWAIEQSVADADRVCIMGGSYGGYATLVGLTFTPEKFACGVDIVGPSNLVTLLENMPPYWMPMASLMKDRVGDWTTEEGKAKLLELSPLALVDQIQNPLLIGQGANDPRVKQVESDQIVDAMQQKNIPVTYVLYPDEGHGFARPENRLSFYAIAEAFLAEHLGGRFERIGDAFDASSVAVPAGADGVPGLKNALEKHQETSHNK